MSELRNRVEEFLNEQLSDWDDFKITYEKEDDTIYATIVNELWKLNEEVHFALENDKLCFYNRSESWQTLDYPSENKFFWIHILTV